MVEFHCPADFSQSPSLIRDLPPGQPPEPCVIGDQAQTQRGAGRVDRGSHARRRAEDVATFVRVAPEEQAEKVLAVDQLAGHTEKLIRVRNIQLRLLQERGRRQPKAVFPMVALHAQGYTQFVAL